MQVFRWTGWVLILLGGALLGLFATYIGDNSIAALTTDLGLNGLGFYLVATIGSAAISWGYILVKTASRPELHVPVGVGSALGFIALAFMRLWAIMSGDPAFEPFAAFLPGEVILFLAIAIALLQVSIDFWGRLKDVYFSFRTAPGWVQAWVMLILAPINMVPFFLYGMTQHPLAGWTAFGFTFVLIWNVAIVIYERGVSKLTSVPHLPPWIPLQIYAGMWLFVWGGLSPLMTAFAWAYFVIVGISNVLDIYDTARWLRGDRAVMA